jgi:hypothetical protein
MKRIARLEKNKSFWFLLFISFIFFILRWPSLFEPYWYGDEGIYQAVGMLINDGQKLYSGAWDNKPPLLYVLYAIFNSDQFIVRIVSLIFGLLSVWVFYLLSDKLFSKSKKAAYVSTSIFAVLFGTKILEGNIANAENFMLLPIITSAYLVVSTDFIKKILIHRYTFIAGLVLSTAFLTKIVAVFDFLAFSSFLFVDPEKSFKDKFKERLIPFALGFAIPVIATFIYFFATNNFKDFFDAFLFSNVVYVGYGNEFIIPQGLLYLKAFILFSFVGILFFKRKSVSRNFLFISIWFAFSLFNAFFSHRPYTHYLLVLLPSFALMIGAIIADKKERLLLIAFLIIGILAVHNTFKLNVKKVVPYYMNMVNFCGNKKDVASYQGFFDWNTPRDYELARYIKSNTNSEDRIFIWGNNAQLYKLSDKTPIMRYTVAYHITNYKTGISEMENAIKNKKPRLIIVMPNVPEFPLPLTGYEEKINLKDVLIYEKSF